MMNLLWTRSVPQQDMSDAHANVEIYRTKVSDEFGNIPDRITIEAVQAGETAGSKTDVIVRAAQAATGVGGVTGKIRPASGGWGNQGSLGGSNQATFVVGFGTAGDEEPWAAEYLVVYLDEDRTAGLLDLKVKAYNKGPTGAK